MLSLRSFVIVIAGAGLLFAGLPLTDARACDDDRYPCPVRSQTLTQETADAPTETADAPARPAPSAPPRKKVSHPTRPSEKAQAKGEREAPRAHVRAEVNQPAVQEQVADAVSQKAADPAPSSGTLQTNPFYVQAGKTIVLITFNNHGFKVGSLINTSGATAVSGIEINGTFPIVENVDVNNFGIDIASLGVVPTVTASGGGSSVAYSVMPSSRADQPLNDEGGDESRGATAATALPVLPHTEGAGASAPGPTGIEATEAARANAVQLVEPNEVNDAATVPWIAYLLLILGAALLAAALTIWFFAGRTSVYARRPGRPRAAASTGGPGRLRDPRLA